MPAFSSRRKAQGCEGTVTCGPKVACMAPAPAGVAMHSWWSCQSSLLDGGTGLCSRRCRPTTCRHLLTFPREAPVKCPKNARMPSPLSESVSGLFKLPCLVAPASLRERNSPTQRQATKMSASRSAAQHSHSAGKSWINAALIQGEGQDLGLRRGERPDLILAIWSARNVRFGETCCAAAELVPRPQDARRSAADG